MVREISSGGVVLRKRDNVWFMAVIEPPSDEASTRDHQQKIPAARKKAILALPKGAVDPGEKPAETALREVHEETGITADIVAKLADIKYTYSRSWGDGARVFKIVSFYLMRYVSGRINQIDPAMRIEVSRASWIPLADAARLLAYTGEKQMARKAQQYIETHLDF